MNSCSSTRDRPTLVVDLLPCPIDDRLGLVF
jgi:hypothetical protein